MLAVLARGMSFHGGLLGPGAGFFCSRLVARLAFFEPRPDAFSGGDADRPVFELARRRFINAELWGRATDLPWGVIFPTAGSQPRHPSQLYEATLEGLVLFAVMLWFAHRPYRPETRGALSGIFLIGYALARILAEFFREPDVQIGYLPGGITMGQLLSIPMLLFGLFLVARAGGVSVLERQPWMTGCGG